MDSTSSELKELEDDLLALEDEAKEKEAQMEDLKSADDKFVRASSKIAETDEEVLQLKSELRALKDELEESESDCKALETKLEHSGKLLDDGTGARERIGDLQATVKELNARLEVERETSARAESELDTLGKRFARSNESQQSFERRIRQSRTETDDIIAQLEELEDKYRAQRKELTEKD